MLVWMDLEMTGLDHTSDVIVEIATIITDDELHEDYIIPSCFNPEVAPAVAAATRRVASEEGLARITPED
jgi:oligoribonuclease (3'-5' exoribonuclease)